MSSKPFNPERPDKENPEWTRADIENARPASEVLPEQYEWLMANREVNDAKIRTGIEEMERGEGIPEDELDAYLARLKAR